MSFRIARTFGPWLLIGTLSSRSFGSLPLLRFRAASFR